MRSRTLLLPLLLTAALLVPGCKAATDANTPCYLVAGDGDGGRKGITEFDLSLLGGSKHDQISFGSVECDDQICVRDIDYLTDAGLGSQTTCNTDADCHPGELCSARADSTSTPSRHCSPAAGGYCSHSCIEGETCQSQDSSLDDSPLTRLTCRALLLDSDTLAAICAGDGGTDTCVKYFGGNTSPFFCARGSTPDGGS